MINSLLVATADSNCIYNFCCFIYTLNACYYIAFRKFALTLTCMLMQPAVLPHLQSQCSISLSLELTGICIYLKIPEKSGTLPKLLVFFRLK